MQSFWFAAGAQDGGKVLHWTVVPLLLFSLAPLQAWVTVVVTLMQAELVS